MTTIFDMIPKIIEREVIIYGPDETALHTITITWEAGTELADIIADTTEAVVAWCSANGYTYDECDWDYVT